MLEQAQKPQSVATQAIQPSREQNCGAGLGALRLLGQLARLIENEVYDGSQRELVESKLLSEINAKKREQGLKIS